MTCSNCRNVVFLFCLFQWNEVSTYIQEISPNEPLKVYTSCYVTSHDVNNWLRAPFTEVGEAKSLWVEMIFTMRKCVKHSDPSILQQCRETFNLYQYDADRDFANDDMPKWDAITYTRIDTIPAEILSESTSDILLNTETRFVSLKPGYRGIYFAFQDTGACVSLVSIKVYYKVCSNTTQNYAFFSATPTGENQASSVQKVGVCVPNASQFQRPTYRCMSDGSWDIPLGGCQCDQGFEGVDGEKCVRKYLIVCIYVISIILTPS